jgi:hypothetical protein
MYRSITNFVITHLTNTLDLAGPLFRSDWNFAVAGGQSVSSYIIPHDFYS